MLSFLELLKIANIHSEGRRFGMSPRKVFTRELNRTCDGEDWGFDLLNTLFLLGVI